MKNETKPKIFMAGDRAVDPPVDEKARRLRVFYWSFGIATVLAVVLVWMYSAQVAEFIFNAVGMICIGSVFLLVILVPLCEAYEPPEQKTSAVFIQNNFHILNQTANVALPSGASSEPMCEIFIRGRSIGFHSLDDVRMMIRNGAIISSDFIVDHNERLSPEGFGARYGL